MEAVIHKFYPNAIKTRDFIPRMYEIFREYELKPENILVAQSLCSDDINSIQFPMEVRQTLGPFNLGGLAGFPFGGLTGMGAFAHHVPGNGAAAIAYAPHIGIGSEGVPGRILRVGQEHTSGCCGAVLKALERLEKNQITKTPQNPYDYQQETLESIIAGQSDRILKSQNHLIEAVEVILEASGHVIDHVMGQTAFTGRYVFVVGGIMINADLREEPFVDLRRFDCYDLRTRAKHVVNVSRFRSVQ